MEDKKKEGQKLLDKPQEKNVDKPQEKKQSKAQVIVKFSRKEKQCFEFRTDSADREYLTYSKVPASKGPKQGGDSDIFDPITIKDVIFDPITIKDVQQVKRKK